MDFENHRCTNEKQKCILFKCKYDIKKVWTASPSNIFAHPTPIPKPFLRL